MTGFTSAPRLGLSRLPETAWVVVGAVVAAVGGALVADGSKLPLDFALAGTTAILIARFRFAALLALVVIAPLDKAFIQFLVVTGGVLYLAFAMRRLPAPYLSVPWLAFVLIALMSVPWTPSVDDLASPRFVPGLGSEYLSPTSTEADQWLVLAFALVMFLLAAQFVREVSRVQIMVGAVIATSAYPILKGLQQLATSSYHPAEQANTYQPRSNYNAIESTFAHPNPFAFYLTLVLVVAIVAFIEMRRPQWRVPLGVLILAAGVCLLNTYTRSAWLAFAAGLLLLGIWRYRILILVGAVMLPLAGYAAPSAVREVSKRFGDLTSKSEAHERNSWDWRREQWGRMWHWGSERPFTGQGFGSYQETTVKEFGYLDSRFSTLPAGPGSGRGLTAHNDYVKTFVELGWPGLLLWIAVMLGLVGAMVAAARAPGLAPWATGVGVVAVVAAGIGYADNLQAGYGVVFFSLMAALAGAITGAASARSQHQSPG